MEETTFPPSPNWYLPDILDVASDGTICYGTNTNLAVLGVTHTEDDRLKISKLDIIPHVHRERVSVVSFGPPGVCGKMIATIGGDSYVKVWDTQTGLVYQVHQQHGVSAKLRGMDWSSANRQQIVSVDESGTFVLFDVRANKSDKVVFQKMHATVLACCPHKWQWVAVGEVSGLVSIVSITGSGSVIRKMRGHDNPVLSLSWSPVMGNVFLTGFRGSESSELLLASGACSRNVFVWRAGSDGRCQMEILQPTGASGQAKPRNAGTAVGINGGYAAVCWARPNKLLTSTIWGELLCWDLDELASWQRAYDKIVYNPQQKNAGRTVLAKTHQRGLFSIACTKMKVPEVPDACGTDWRKKEEPVEEPRVLVWSTSQDRQLVATDLAGGGQRLALPTLGGFVYCMALSKLDCHKVAVGAGDGTIRVWNMATPGAIDVRAIWLKIKGRVTALAWHPTHDSLLAYGTSEGRVGVYDMANTARGPTHLWSYHKKSVYSLGWGPVATIRGVIRMSTQKHFLYSCGDDVLLCYDLYKEEETFQDVSTCCYVNKKPVAVKVTEFAWKDDYSVVAIGTDTGCVHLCTSPNLDVIATVYPLKKIIHSLEWHPIVTTTEPGGSALRHLLAFASTENSVKIYDFEQTFSGAGEQGAVDAASFTTISGHTERVTQVAWNPHVGGMLVTASYDGSAQIWDVRGGSVKLIALFAGHAGWVVCVRWCPMDADFVITGSSDFTLRAWRISSQDTKKRAKPLTIMSPQVETATPAIRVNKGKKEPAKLRPPAASSAAEVEGATAGTSTTTVSGPGLLTKSHFPISSRTRNLGKDGLIASTYCLLKAKRSAAVDEETNDPTIDTGNMVHLGFFSDKDAMNHMLDMEGVLHY